MAVILLLVVIVAASFTTSTCAPTNTGQLLPIASAVAAKFLRARCDTTTELSMYCYNSLLPRADSFNGSDAKVAFAATADLVFWVRLSLREMRHVNSMHKDAWVGQEGGCIQLMEETTHGDTEVLASLGHLEALGNGEKLSERDLEVVKKWIATSDSKINECWMNFGDDVGELLPITNAHLVQSQIIADSLFKAIPL